MNIFYIINHNTTQRMSSTILKSTLLSNCRASSSKGKGLKTQFSGAVECQFENGARESAETDFIERGKRPLCKALKIVEASLTGDPIYPIFMDCAGKAHTESVNQIMQDIINTLERGEIYRFCNWTSSKLQPTPSALLAVQTAYVKFKYFGGLTDTSRPLTVTPTVEQLLHAPVGECTVTPVLVRQAPRSPYCYVKPLVPPLVPPPADDLERRYQRLLGL